MYRYSLAVESAIGCHVDEPEVREVVQLKEYAAIVQLDSVLRNDQGTDNETSVRRQLGRAERAVGGSGAQIGMGTGAATVVRKCVARRN